MISLSLESDRGDIDLGALSSNAEGAEVQPGVSGLGLPPLDIQWATGAGDGATYRGQRVLPRDIDIPIEFVAASRANLQTQIDDLSKVLDGECTLRASDGATSWWVNVHRVSGGDYATGVDTNGQFNMRMTLTLRAGDPFWTSGGETVVSQTGTGIGPTISLPNSGTADAYPYWEITGPGKNLEITSPNGEVLKWTSRLLDGEKLYIDTQFGTVVDALGSNRYAYLGAAPRFSRVRPGSNSFSVSFPVHEPILARTNLITNPSLETNATGWTPTYGNGVTAARQTSDGFIGNSCYSYLVTSDGYGHSITLQNGASRFAVTANQPYTFSAYSQISALAYSGGVYAIPTIYYYNSGGSIVGSTQGATTLMTTLGVYERMSTTATAPATAVSADIRVIITKQFGGGIYTGDKFLFDNALFEQTASVQPYFDGATTDTVPATYSWTGTAHASTSTLYANPIYANAKVQATYSPRKWMVI